MLCTEGCQCPATSSCLRFMQWAHYRVNAVSTRCASLGRGCRETLVCLCAEGDAGGPYSPAACSSTSGRPSRAKEGDSHVREGHCASGHHQQAGVASSSLRILCSTKNSPSLLHRRHHGYSTPPIGHRPSPSSVASNPVSLHLKGASVNA